jgi:hypothetical protein
LQSAFISKLLRGRQARFFRFAPFRSGKNQAGNKLCSSWEISCDGLSLLIENEKGFSLTWQDKIHKIRSFLAAADLQCECG